MLLYLAKVFSNTLIFLLQKYKQLTYIFFFSSKNINVFAGIFQDRNFNVTLANNFVKFLTTGFWLVRARTECSVHIPKIIKRIFRECEVQTEKKSVPRVTVRHHEDCRMKPNGYPE